MIAAADDDLRAREQRARGDGHGVLAPETRGVVRRVRQPVAADVDAVRHAAVREARVRVAEAAKEVATRHQPHVELEVGALARRARGVLDEELAGHGRLFGRFTCKSSHVR